MGKRGPQKTPTATLKLRGSWRADTRDGEPEAISCDLAVPDWLDSERSGLGEYSTDAMLKWTELAKMLDNSGVLSATDKEALARYCWFVGKLRQQVKTAPNDIHTIRKVTDACIQLEREFGLTPAARTNVKSDKPVKEAGQKKQYFM